MAVYKKTFLYSDNCIYTQSCKDDVRLYTLFKTNCKNLTKKTLTDNNKKFAEEMCFLRKFLNENKIIFPVNISKIEIIKDKLSNFLIENDMDIILILMDKDNINLMFVSEDDNNMIITQAEKIIFKQSNIVTYIVNI